MAASSDRRNALREVLAHIFWRPRAPTAIRSIPSVTPAAKRASGVIALVRRASRMGQQALGIAKIVRNVDQLQRLGHLEGAPFLPPATSNVTTPPPADICFLADRVCCG
jgi:hypothetical protein